MNKVEFLDALHRRIDMLDDAEVVDILNEYSLHIECKVKCGMTEDEAVADFGDVGELAADVLAAYHVKAGCATAAPGAAGNAAAAVADVPGASACVPETTPQADAAGAAEGPIGILRRAWKGACSLARRGCDAVVGAFRGFCTGCACFCDRAWSKIRREGNDRADVEASCATSAHPGSAGAAVPKRSTAFARLSAMCRGFCQWVVRCVRFALRLVGLMVKWCVVFALMAAVLFCACSSIASVFCFGVVAVMSLMGYPLIGAALVLLGASAMAVSVTVLGFNAVRWHVVPWGVRRSGAGASAENGPSLIGSVRAKGAESPDGVRSKGAASFDDTLSEGMEECHA